MASTESVRNLDDRGGAFGAAKSRRRDPVLPRLAQVAHAFSAGGPILWPNVDALLFVPLAAHALFARPLVVGPESWFALEVTERSESEAQVVLDGSRSIDVLRGGRVEVRRGTHPVKLARMSDAPFTERLVRKFSLPINGWRGPVQGG